MRDILTGLAILVIALLCAAIAVPFLIDWNSWRAQVEDRASTAIGRPVKIDGPLNLRFLPAPVLRIGEFQIGGKDDRITATAKKAKIELSLTALMRGEFRITDATLDNPVFAVHADRAATENTVVVPTIKDIPLAAIEQLQIVDGVVEHTSPDGKRSQPLRGSFSVEAVAMKGPWRVAGRAIVEERNYDVRLATGVLDTGGRLPLKLSIADAGLAFVADIDGAALFADDARGALPKIEGRINASGSVAWPFGKQAGLQPWRMQAQGTSTAKGFSATSVELEAGPQDTAFRAAGEGELAIAEGFAASLKLKARAIDFDKMRATDEPQRTRIKDEEITGLLERMLVAPPFPIALALEGDTIIAYGDSIGPYKLNSSLNRGRFVIEEFSTALPGQSRLSASGTAAVAATPQFDGVLKISSGNPGKTWSWLTQAPPDAAAAPRFARLRDMAGEFPVQVTPSAITSDQFRITADGGTITGDARYRMPKEKVRARLDATVQADQLDLDLFPSAQSGGSGATDFSINIDAKAITARSLNAQSLGALTLTARSEESALNIERFELRGGDAARLSGSGKLSAAGGRIDMRVDANDVSPLLIAAHRLFPGLNLAPTIERAATLNPAALSVAVQRSGTGDDLGMTVKGSVGPTSIDATLGGNARKRPNETWDASLERGTLNLRTQDFAQLLNQLGAGLTAPASQKIPATVTVRSGALNAQSADFRKRPDWIFEGDVGGVAFSARGLATEGYVPTGNGPFTLVSADAAALLRLLGIVEPAANTKMPLDIKGTAEFGLGGLRAQNVRGSVGSAQIENGMAHWPFLPGAKLRAQFSFTRFSLAELTMFLLGPDAASGTGLWPSGRFNAVRRPMVDFDVEVQARTMPFGALPEAKNASMRITSAPTGIQMPGFGADFAGGRLGFFMNFRHDGSLVAASGRIETTAIDAAAFGVQAITGKFDTVIDIAGVGESASQIVQSLGGAGSVTARGLKIFGLDPQAGVRAQSQFLGKDAPATAAPLAISIEQEMQKSAWTAGQITAPMTITRGAIRIGPAQHELNNVQASGQAQFDLRSESVNAILTLSHRAEPDTSEFTVKWAGPWKMPARSVDAGMLHNRLQLAAIGREQERLSILEQDARERAAFNRRARAERELREREEAKKRETEELQRRADAERRAAEDAIRRAEQERRTLEEMARRASEQQRTPDVQPPRPGAPQVPAAPLQITPR